MVAIDAMVAAVAVFWMGYALHDIEWITAVLVADLNAIAGFAAFGTKMNRPVMELFASVSKVMFFRLAGLGIVLWLALVKAGFSKMEFTIVLFVAYICKSVAEMILLKNMNSRKQA
jgi:hypothetical protein